MFREHAVWKILVDLFIFRQDNASAYQAESLVTNFNV